MAKHRFAYGRISFLPIHKKKCNFCHPIFVLAWFVWHILKGFRGFLCHVLFWQFLRISTLQSATLRNSPPELIRLLCSFRKFGVAYATVHIQPLYREIREVLCQAHGSLANTCYLVVYNIAVIGFFDRSRSLVSHSKETAPILWGTHQHYEGDFPY